MTIPCHHDYYDAHAAPPCTCLAYLRPNIIYIRGATLHQTGPLIPHLTFHTNNRICLYTWQIHQPSHPNQKKDKYEPLIKQICAQGWIVNPLKVIIAWVRDAIQTKRIKEFNNVHIHMPSIKKSVQNIHQITIKYLTYFVLNTWKLDNKHILVPPL